MMIRKEHKAFQQIDLAGPEWHSPPGYPQEIEQKILAGKLDEASKFGNRTRLLRFKPGAFTTMPFVHDYWEEVYLIEGDLTVGDLASGVQPIAFGRNTYACRPPGVAHGPFRSQGGCVLFEVHYYE